GACLDRILDPADRDRAATFHSPLSQAVLSQRGDHHPRNSPRMVIAVTVGNEGLEYGTHPARRDQTYKKVRRLNSPVHAHEL
ncbi:MAG TPA: hypothetical protein VNZ58_14260, partial [Thermomicrobiales bacterium]|nr:hypothetical protein [Thermomicrobiales bacterium]